MSFYVDIFKILLSLAELLLIIFAKIETCDFSPCIKKLIA
ncbi:MAG: hypothetical protein ACJAZK_000159 [Psychroserpens sp.]|jgi:hypothetical protein